MNSFLTLLCVFEALLVQVSSESPPSPPPRPVPPPCRYSPKENEYFSTVNFPASFNQDYENRVRYNCNYTMVAPENKKVLLTFHHFEMSGGYRCGDGALSFYHANGTIKNKVCGQSEGEFQVLSDNNNMTFNLLTGRYTTSRGFLASWKSVSQDYSLEASNQGSYFLTHPTNLMRRGKEMICLDLLDGDHQATELTVDVFPFQQYNKGGPVESYDWSGSKGRVGGKVAAATAAGMDTDSNDDEEEAAVLEQMLRQSFAPAQFNKRWKRLQDQMVTDLKVLGGCTVMQLQEIGIKLGGAAAIKHAVRGL